MINIYSQSGQVTYGIKYYIVDTENEKNSLPTKDKMGSKCYVIESETWYILNGNEEWVPFVGEDSTADAILISIKNMSAEQKDQLKEELDIEGGGAVSSVNGKTGAVVLDANDIGALPDDTPIPAAVTEQTVSNWGFTKNTGTYSKPMGGIPDSDIASAEAWNAKGTYSKPSDGIPASDLAAGVIPDISGKANAADVYTKTEVDQKLVGAMDYKGTKATVSVLPTSGNETGDVWHITADGSEWAWNGSTWEELGSAVDLSGYRTASAQDTIDAAQNSAIAAKYIKPSGGIPKSDLASTVQTSLEKADTALQSVPPEYATENWVTNKGYGTYSKPTSGIPKSDLSSAVQTSLEKADTALQSVPSTYRTASAQDIIDTAQDTAIAAKYTKPSGGIPDSDIASAATWNAKGTYSKPSGGIPKTDLASAVQTSLGKADTALQSHQSLAAYRTATAQDTIDAAQDQAIAAKYTKPSGGIPKSDLASAVQTSLGKADTALQSVPNTYRTAAAQDLIDEAQDARINQKADASALAKVATTGSYNDLSNKPTIPSLNGYATETWVTEKGYQTATQVQTAISNVRQLPVVSTSDNGKFLRVVSGAWAAAIVPSAETTSF